jgi:hypothetical protein
VSVVADAGVTVPPFASNVIMKTGTQFAVYVLSPVLPDEIDTLVRGVVPLVPVQPVNMYPSLVGLRNVKDDVVIL